MLCVEHDAQEDAQSSVLGYRCILCTKSNDNNLVSMREGIKVDSSANDTRMIKSIWAVSIKAPRNAQGCGSDGSSHRPFSDLTCHNSADLMARDRSRTEEALSASSRDR